MIIKWKRPFHFQYSREVGSEAAILQRVRNSSPEYFRLWRNGSLAPKMIGSKKSTEDKGPAFGGAVGERPDGSEAVRVSDGGAHRE